MSYRTREWVVVTGVTVGILALCAAVVASIVLGISAMERRGCARTAEAMGRDWRYNGVSEGCFVRLDNGTWLLLENYRLTNTEAGS